MTQPGTTAAPKKKGGGALWTGVFLLILSTVGGIALLVMGIAKVASAVDGLQRVQVPGSKTFQLQPGDYSIYTHLSFSSIGADVTITDSSGAKVPTRPVTGTESIGSTSGSGTWYADESFTIGTAGTYTVTATDEFAGTGTGIGSGDEVAIGPDIAGILGPSLAMIFGGVFGGGLLFVIGLIVLIVGLVKRSRSKKSSVPPYQPPTYGSPGGYGAPQPGYGAAPPQYPPPGPAPQYPPPGYGN